MNVVFLAPHFPNNYYQFCANLHKLGATVLAIADEKYENLHQDLTSVLTEYYQVNDMHDYDQLVRAIGYFTHKYGKIDCVESHSEEWLATDARLRTDFNITGLKNEFIKQLRQKSLMKKKFIKAGVNALPGKVVRTLKDATIFTKKIGYPLVAKPDIELGVAGTYTINNQQELMEFFAYKPPVDYYLESFIIGKIYTFDGLVDRDGKLVFYTSHAVSEGLNEMFSDDLDSYSYSLRDIPKNLEEAGMNTLKAFDIRERFFHFEFIITPEDQVVLYEINMCPPNGVSMDLFNFANDIDLYYEWGNILVNGSTTMEYNRKYHSAYIGRKKNQNYLHSHEEIMENFGPLIVQQNQVTSSSSGTLDHYGYLARSPELNDMLQIMDFIHAK